MNEMLDDATDKYGKHQLRKENLVSNRQQKKGTGDNSRYTKYKKENKKTSRNPVSHKKYKNRVSLK